MRTIKELLQLVYDYEGKEKFMSMCYTIGLLFIIGEITIGEQHLLINYIKDNKPEDALEDSHLWFKMFDWQPRNEWLLKHINLNK